MNKTSIEWTDYTWNPIRARLKGQSPKVRSGTFCTRISPGCTNCYASVINKRFGNGLEYTVPNLERVEFSVDEKILEEPLRRKKPARIFVGDMFDLFHEAIAEQFIGSVFEIMQHARQHQFQVLTKRAQRLHDVLTRASAKNGSTLPLPNVWLGVSVEDQKRADERIPLLERTPAAIRFLSVEPMLEEIWIEPELMGQTSCGRPDWIICGGESGPGARPFNLAWAESLLKQCRAAEVPFFMKQVGTHPIIGDENLGYLPALLFMRDRKGGTLEEWPEALRVREFPSQKAEAVLV